MKQLKLAAAIFTGLTLYSSTVSASTMAYDWTGYYVGLNAGLVKYTMNMTDNQATTFNATIQQAANPKIIGGAQVGYRYQLSPACTSGVVGAEFSMNVANANSTQHYGSPFALYNLTSNAELNNLALLQLIGGIAADRTFLFVAAGLSWTNITGKVNNISGTPFVNSFSLDKKVLGTALGGGIEYAFTNQISGRVKVDVITPNVYTTSDSTGNTFHIANNIVQATVGVNYKFC